MKKNTNNETQIIEEKENKTMPYANYMEYVSARKKFQKDYCVKMDLLPNLKDIMNKLDKSEIAFIKDILNLRVMAPQSKIMLKFQDIEISKNNENWKETALGKDSFSMWSEYCLQTIVLPKAISLYRRYFGTDDISLTELINEGYMGIKKAWKNFMPITPDGKPAMFSTYAEMYITNEMYFYLSDKNSARYQTVKVSSFLNQYYIENKEYPSVDMISKKTRIPTATVKMVLKKLSYFDVTKAGKLMMKSCILEEEKYVDVSTTQSETKKAYVQAFLRDNYKKYLSEREAYIIEEYFFNNKMAQEIAPVLKVSEVRVFQIKQDALKKLKVIVEKIMKQ